MKRTESKPRRFKPPTLADLCATVSQLTHNERLAAAIVADMVNSRLVRLEGRYHGRRVVIA